MTTVCEICGDPHKARGLCRKHYDEWRYNNGRYPSYTKEQIREKYLKQKTMNPDGLKKSWKGAMKKYRANPDNHIKVKARKIAQKKVRLKKECEKCGSNNGLGRHHHDYGKPCSVETLCRECHDEKEYMR